MLTCTGINGWAGDVAAPRVGAVALPAGDGALTAYFLTLLKLS